MPRLISFIEHIVRPHREGLLAILIHCAMHCYRTGDDQWFDFVGMLSPGHGLHYSYTVDNVKPDHPIMKEFGQTFVAPKGKLYHSIKLFDTATALGQAKRQIDEEIRALVNVPQEQASANVLPQNCCGEGNLDYKKAVTSKSFQTGNERHQLSETFSTSASTLT